MYSFFSTRPTYTVKKLGRSHAGKGVGFEGDQLERNPDLFHFPPDALRMSIRDKYLAIILQADLVQ